MKQEDISGVIVFAAFVIGMILLFRSIKKTRDNIREASEKDPQKFNGSQYVKRIIKILKEKEGIFLIEIDTDPSYFFHTQIWVKKEGFPIQNACCGDAFMMVIEDNKLLMKQIWMDKNNVYVFSNISAVC